MPACPQGAQGPRLLQLLHLEVLLSTDATGNLVQCSLTERSKRIVDLELLLRKRQRTLKFDLRNYFDLKTARRQRSV